jgi:hypothetical protein
MNRLLVAAAAAWAIAAAVPAAAEPGADPGDVSTLTPPRTPNLVSVCSQLGQWQLCVPPG